MATSEEDTRARWTGWQHAHQQALEALQGAEAAYHRLTAEQAFGRGDDEPARARRMEALTRLDGLRVRLDEIREQRPPWPY
ncbi:MAG: hypothetical protein ABI665_20655 [Vicinamibacterales bacterium]